MDQRDSHPSDAQDATRPTTMFEAYVGRFRTLARFGCRPSRSGSRGLLALLAALAIAAAGPMRAQAPVDALPERDAFHLFLLVGQSNMAGRGLVEPQDTVPIPRVLMLDKAGRWVPATDPMHFDKPIAGVGLARSFAARLAEARPGITIGLVPAAVGGSPIDAWRPGVFYEPTKSHPWDDAIARARSAMKAGTLKGILWHQGESDATRQLAPIYEAKLVELVARFRATLDAPDIPFIVGQLGRYPDVPWDDARRTVDGAHRALPARVRGAVFVSSDGLVHGGDKVHFDAASLRAFGRRYADAYLGLP
jgi:hypothetical protein